MTSRRLPTAAQAALLLSLSKPNMFAVGSTPATIKACIARGWITVFHDKPKLLLTWDGLQALDDYNCSLL